MQVARHTAQCHAQSSESVPQPRFASYITEFTT